MGSGWNRRKRSAVFRGAAAVALAASTAGAAANPSVLAQRGNDFSGYGSAKAVEILVPSGLPSGVTSNGHALLNAGSLLDGVVHGVGKTVSGITGELLGRDSLLNGVIDGVGHTVSGVAESLLGGWKVLRDRIPAPGLPARGEARARMMSDQIKIPGFRG